MQPKNYYHLVYHCAVLILITPMFLVSCDYVIKSQGIFDGGLLSGDPCSAPCYERIIPGETTLDDAIEIMEKIGFDTYEQKRNKIIVYSNSIYISYNSQAIVDGIAYDLRATGITIQDVIDKYGSPNWISVTLDDMGGADVTLMNMDLCFNEITTCISLESQDAFGKYSIKHETRIEFVNYYDFSTYSSLINHENYTKWHDYGDYEYLGE
jgi:hypothetical protein